MCAAYATGAPAQIGLVETMPAVEQDERLTLARLDVVDVDAVRVDDWLADGATVSSVMGPPGAWSCHDATVGAPDGVGHRAFT